MSVTADLRWKQRTRIDLSTWPVATAPGSDVDFDEHRYSDSNVTVGSNIGRRVTELLHFKLESKILEFQTEDHHEERSITMKNDK
jgi:hypothetical protein